MSSRYAYRGAQLTVDPLAELWQQSRPIFDERLATLREATAAAQQGALTEALCQRARTEAHRLAGTLGIFGQAHSSELALQIERLFRPGDAGDGARAAELAGLYAELDRAFSQPFASGTLLPAKEQPPGCDAFGRAGARPQSAAQPASASILVADDDDSVAKVIETALGRAGHSLVRARDGLEALRLAGEHHFDVILLDIQMPNLDGHAACRAMRSTLKLTTPIIMLSARSDSDSISSGFEDGATDYIMKPFAVAQLRARVETWLMRSAARSNHKDRVEH
jgi:CheY-like chemotaxis protein